MESQLQNPEFRNNPEKLSHMHYCIKQDGRFHKDINEEKACSTMTLGYLICMHGSIS